jgi:hypothetical protein
MDERDARVDGSAKNAKSRYFAALRHYKCRLLWIGTLVSNSAEWLDMVALNWLIVSQSGSALDMALVNVFRAIPIFFALTLVGDAMTDRVERRMLLIVI